MIPVMQNILTGPTANCKQATLASIFEKRLEEVPNFMTMRSEWHDKFDDWCREQGVYPLWIEADAVDDPAILLGYSEMVVETGRGRLHSVVGCRGKVAHDPYPGGSEYTRVVGYTIFVSLLDAPPINADGVLEED